MSKSDKISLKNSKFLDQRFGEVTLRGKAVKMRYNVIYSDYWIPRSHLRDVALGDHLVKSAEIVYPQRHLRGPLGGPNCLNRCYIAHITCK